MGNVPFWSATSYLATYVVLFVQLPELNVSVAGEAVGSSPEVGKQIVGATTVSIASLKTTVSVKVWLPTLASAIVVRFGVRQTSVAALTATLRSTKVVTPRVSVALTVNVSVPAASEPLANVGEVAVTVGRVPVAGTPDAT